MNNETLENVISKSVKYIKDVKWSGGGGKIYVNILIIWVYFKIANLHVLGSETKLNKSKILRVIL